MNPSQNPSLSLLFISFLWLGLTSFGGPAMIAYIRRMAVEQKNWLDNETFELKRETGYRKSDGALYESLSDEEVEILDKDQTLIEYRYETTYFKRPPFQE